METPTLLHNILPPPLPPPPPGAGNGILPPPPDDVVPWTEVAPAYEFPADDPYSTYAANQAVNEAEAIVRQAAPRPRELAQEVNASIGTRRQSAVRRGRASKIIPQYSVDTVDVVPRWPSTRSIKDSWTSPSEDEIIPLAPPEALPSEFILETQEPLIAEETLSGREFVPTTSQGILRRGLDRAKEKYHEVRTSYRERAEANRVQRELNANRVERPNRHLSRASEAVGDVTVNGPNLNLVYGSMQDQKDNASEHERLHNEAGPTLPMDAGQDKNHTQRYRSYHEHGPRRGRGIERISDKTLRRATGALVGALALFAVAGPTGFSGGTQRIDQQLAGPAPVETIVTSTTSTTLPNNPPVTFEAPAPIQPPEAVAPATTRPAPTTTRPRPTTTKASPKTTEPKPTTTRGSTTTATTAPKTTLPKRPTTTTTVDQPEGPATTTPPNTIDTSQADIMAEEDAAWDARVAKAQQRSGV